MLKKILKRILSNYLRVLIDLKSDEFSLLIADIFEGCEALKPNSELTKAYRITELQFRDSLEKTFLQMKKYRSKSKIYCDIFL